MHQLIGMHLSLAVGFRVNEKPHKSVPPAQQQKFVGVLLDSVTMQARLDPEKLAKATHLVCSFERKTKCTQRELQSLVGFLQWASKVIYGGRVFLRRLITLQNYVTRPNHRVRLTADSRHDLAWWRTQGLPQFNGAAMIVPSVPMLCRSFQCDSCGAGGLGVFFEGGYVDI